MASPRETSSFGRRLKDHGLFILPEATRGRGTETETETETDSEAETVSETEAVSEAETAASG